MKRFVERNYVVKETGPVYFTKDMDKTVCWFEDVLGWYSEIDARDENGVGQYGCVYSIPKEIERHHLAPFAGIHLFFGEPVKGMIAFMHVKGIDSLYKYVKSKYDGITEVIAEPWGAKTCMIISPDESILKFFEVN